MFAMSRSDLKSAYTCGTYHRRGREGCTSHHIRVDKLERRDLERIIRQIKVYEDHLEIQLQADVDAILRSGTLPEAEEAVAAMARHGDTVNFEDGMEHISPVTIVQAAKKRPDKVFHANIISDGD